MTCAFYPGSFDPLTVGHSDIIRRGLMIFDRLVVGIGVNPAKSPMFSDIERSQMLREDLHDAGGRDRSDVVLFHGLAVEAAKTVGASCILRGLRDAGDLAYEAQLAGMNRQLSPEIETVFMVSSPGTQHVTGTLVRQIAKLGGDPSPFVPPSVAGFLKRKLGADREIAPPPAGGVLSIPEGK